MAKPIPAPEHIIEHVASLVDREGEATASRRLGVSRQTTARVLARLPLQRVVIARLETAAAENGPRNAA